MLSCRLFVRSTTANRGFRIHAIVTSGSTTYVIEGINYQGPMGTDFGLLQ